MPVAFLNSAVASRFSYTASNRKLRIASVASSTGALMRISARLPACVSVTTSFTIAAIREEDVEPSTFTGPRGRSDSLSTPARTASSIS
jgi:hypothetical protein